jgi:plastocyanin
MSHTPSFLATLVCGTALALGFSAYADACDSAGKKVRIQVKVDAAGQPEADPDTVDVCIGDTIHWIFPGAAKKFKVQFVGDTPVEWHEKTSDSSASIEGTVQPGKVVNNAPTPYKYNVEVDGKVLDPKIIVKP